MIETWRPILVPAQQSGPSFADEYPEYAETCFLDELRAAEYAYLDENEHVYLDYAGSGLPSDAQLRVHLERLRGGCFGNPHTESPASLASTLLIERAKETVLAFFNADPDEYAVIFTPNASAACRLVGEAYPFGAGSRLVLTADNHNSVNGLREYARRAGAKIGYVPLTPPELRVAPQALQRELRRGRLTGLTGSGSRGLFAYPAQSNFTGVRHPLEWVELAQANGYDVLLDAAAYASASMIDLAAVHPDFMPVSWYKVFGYPTGVGCLVARYEALERLRRPWFAGGTVQAVSVRGDWAKLADDETAFEDGTLNFLSIPDVEAGISWIDDIGMDLIGRRVELLTGYLLDRLCALRHADRRQAVKLYGPATTQARGGTIAFNLLDPYGDLVDERAVSRDAAAAGISLRTGCFCNPGAGEYAFELDHRRVTGTIARGADTVDEYLDLLDLPIGGAVRVSLGLVSSVEDVDRLMDFIESTYVDRFPDLTGLEPRLRC